MNSLIVLFIVLTVLIILVSGVEGIRNLVGLGLNFILIFAMITFAFLGDEHICSLKCGVGAYFGNRNIHVFRR